MRTETITLEYKNCGECAHVDSTWISFRSKVYCFKCVPRKIIKDIWGEIPDWCPLEEK